MSDAVFREISLQSSGTEFSTIIGREGIEDTFFLTKISFNKSEKSHKFFFSVTFVPDEINPEIV